MKKTNLRFYQTISALFILCAWSGPRTGSCAEIAWNTDPFHWKKTGDVVEAKGFGSSFLTQTNEQICRTASIAAKVTPLVSGTNTWSILGVSIRADDENFWHLAFVRGPGGSRLLELAEMRDGVWLSQDFDKLPHQQKVKPQMVWRDGETYDLALSFDADAVHGTVCDAAGRLVFDSTYRTTGKPCVGGGAPSLRRNGSFTGRFTDVRVASSGPLPAATDAAFPPYACENFAKGVTGRATGFFHVEKLGERWWVIDPLGRGYVACGCDHVNYDFGWSARTKRSRHREANARLYATRADWEATTVRRLLDWGFNQLGAGCDTKLRHRGLSHTIFLSMGDSLCYSDDDYYILKNKHAPCTAFPNVFHPDFTAWCETLARRKCRAHRNDPWLYGYYLDNEFRWWGHGDVATGLFDDTAKLRTNHTARVALERYLAETVKGGRAAFARLPQAEQREVKLGFLKRCAEKYFSTCAAAIRKVDPNHMILGARFAGLGGAHEAVWTIAGKYTDIVTFNCYPWCDLEREAMYESRGATKTLAEIFDARAAVVGKPMQITEWSFPALDVNLPCLHGAGQRMPTQKERVQATEICAKTFLALPYIVGYDYFMWADEPAEGISDEFPEDSNYGLLNVDAKPYVELTAMFTRLQKDVARWRTAPVPQPKCLAEMHARTAAGAWAERTVSRRPNLVSAARHAAHGECAETGLFTQDATGAFVLSNATVSLRGRVGGKVFAESFQRDGREFGPVSAMLAVRMSSGRRGWITAHVTDKVTWDQSRETLAVTAKGNYEDAQFAITAEFRLDAARVLCEITDIANVGTNPIEADEVYICVRSPFAAETDQVRGQTPPNMWSRESRTGWQAKDGRRLDVVTRSPAVSAAFRYWTGKEGDIHPDAAYRLPMETGANHTVIRPGTNLLLKGTTWAWLAPR